MPKWHICHGIFCYPVPHGANGLRNGDTDLKCFPHTYALALGPDTPDSLEL